MLTRLRHFFADALSAVQQYPGAYLVAIGLAIVGIMMVHSDYQNTDLNSDLARLLRPLLATLPLMIAGPLMKEIKPSLSKRYPQGGQIIALVLGLLFYFTLPADLNTIQTSDALQIAFSIIAAGLSLFGVVVWAEGISSEQLWGHCKQLFVGLAVAALSAMIVRGGINASIASIEYLFNVPIQSEWYFDIGVLAWTLLGTTVWLTRLHNNPEERQYNKLFRFFGLYIFLPLTVVYTLILLAYGIKIIVLRQRPQSGTVWLVGRFMAFSMVGYALMYPLLTDSLRLRRFQQSYMASVILFTLFLIIAIIKRLDYHGFTVEEYYIALLVIWMLTIAIVTLGRKRYSLSGIVLSLLFFLVISIYGPWSATGLTSTIQYNNLVNLLQKNDFLTPDGHIAPRVIDLSGDILTGDLEEIYTAASYLGRQEGSEILQPLYAGTGFEQLSGTSSRNVGEQFMVSLGAKNIFNAAGGYNNSNLRYFSIFTSTPQSLNIAGYSRYMTLDSNMTNSTGNAMKISYARADKSLFSITIDSGVTTIDLHDHLAKLGDRIDNRDSDRIDNQNSQEPLILTGDNYKVILTSINGYKSNTDQTYTIEGYQGVAFIK